MNTFEASDALCGAIRLIEQMCVRPSENLVVTADTASDLRAVEAIVGAARAMGARPVVLILPQLPFQGALADPYIPSSVGAAVQDSDVWIDLTFPYMAGSAVYEHALHNNRTRYHLGTSLRCRGLADLYGRIGADTFYKIQSAFERLMADAGAAQCRITSPAGSDVRFQLGKPGFDKIPRAIKPGFYSAPASMLMFPEGESVQGTFVLEAMFHEYYCALPDPLKVEFEGSIKKVSGGGSERMAIDRALQRACGGNPGYVVHLTHAFNPLARFTGTNILEDSRAAGNNAVGLGRPFWIAASDGENHPDGIISRQSLWIGGEQVVRDGALTGPLAKFEEELQAFC